MLARDFMKTNILTCVLLITLSAVYGQSFIDTYYDYHWKETPGFEEASYFSHAVKTDSGWFRWDYFVNSGRNKIQMSGLYEDKENKIRNGIFRWYYFTGELKTFGKYVHGKKEGLWLEWYNNGRLKDSLHFSNGNYSGISMSWFKNGYVKDSLNIDENGNGTYVEWFDNGNPSEAGRYRSGKKQGRWTYYHKNGQVSSNELYNQDTLKQFQLFDENGIPQDDSAIIQKDVEFPNGEKALHNFIHNNLVFPGGYSIQNSDHIVIGTLATIGEDGKVEDVEITLPFHPAFDKEAIRIFTISPLWIPAMNHNRKVKSSFPFVVTFTQGWF